jgi:hypothetical protein
VLDRAVWIDAGFRLNWGCRGYGHQETPLRSRLKKQHTAQGEGNPDVESRFSKEQSLTYKVSIPHMCTFDGMRNCNESDASLDAGICT